MINVPTKMRVYLAAGATDMRKGFDGLASVVQTSLGRDPFAGDFFVFRGRSGNRVKLLYFDDQGLCLFAKRLERGHFVWPTAKDGTVTLTVAQLAMLLEGIDWRMARRRDAPQLAG